jgi:hypothetical protein
LIIKVHGNAKDNHQYVMYSLEKLSDMSKQLKLAVAEFTLHYCKKGQITSPAPKNKNVWSPRVPPTDLRAAISPAITTAAVPCSITVSKFVNNSSV